MFQDSEDNYINQYCTPVRILGQGAFSVVVAAQNQLSNKSVAIKIIEKQNFDVQQLEVLRKEAQLLSQLQHHNIVRATFNKETKNKLYIMMDLIQGITLEEYQRQELDNERVVCITKQILEALKYLHSKDIIHRDIKPQNIMIDPQSLHVTLIDFGLSAQLAYMDGSGVMSDNCGTFLYMAPEQIQRKKYNRSVDIWAMGIVVYNLLNKGKHPFYQQMDDKQIYFEKISQVKWNQFNQLDQKILNFFYKTLAYHPENRLNVNQCLEHPWITGRDDQPLTFIEILKTHTIHNKIKHLIQLLQIIQYMKKVSRIISPPIRNSQKCPTTPVEKMRSRLYSRPQFSVKNFSTSCDRGRKLNSESKSVGSSKISLFKVTDININNNELKRERKSSDQLKKLTQTQNVVKQQYHLFPKLNKSLDKKLKQSHTLPDNSLVQQKQQQNQIFQINKPELKIGVLQQDQSLNMISKTTNQIPQKEVLISQRINSSKPPLKRKKNGE
ncbi:unnamed protein product [Paramecium sonneborni]|uniref:Protein kinase domain-containing protein n=1 Tax=Paramecium sonneborni TaxID=65129 RepID=A0A8S1RH78_9CILI|nr:unnamed protein product [Paramecium sonneborni]